ncbi:hypothetical protein [Roseococcus pinisoli]|uniref:Uncharacterized protein n=1 Tax=Roseococcus pinisoli TaxID=2835040 RepID=A0ABS5QIK8_9PROT|nr:hypothetical protein [Roseococcus pinisoli]MBS7813525.1 hypothetical protein [Roseococcus pinisoli]
MDPDKKQLRVDAHQWKVSFRIPDMFDESMRLNALGEIDNDNGLTDANPLTSDIIILE